MRPRIVLATAVCFIALLGTSFAAEPKSESVPVFTVDSAEVHLKFSAVGDHNNLVTQLSPSDFKIVQDGRHVLRVTSFTGVTDAPFSLLVLTDVSESMAPVIPLVKSAWFKIAQDVVRTPTVVSFMDFGARLKEPTTKKNPLRLTSLYDSSIELMRNWKLGGGRKAVLLITDGQDNYSFNDVSDAVNIAADYDVAFYTISFAPQGTKAEAALRYLSIKTGGMFFAARKKKDILKAVQAVESELGHVYEVTIHVETNESGVHRLAMESTNGKLKFYHRDSYFQPMQRTQMAAIARP